MHNREALEDIEVLGSNLGSVVAGFGNFTYLASRIMLGQRLGKEDGKGMVMFEPNQWYSLNQLLSAFDQIGEQFGDLMLGQVGKQFPKNAVLPPTVIDLDSGLRSLDIAHHMNHAFQHEPMFSLKTGKMKEGIGHYNYSRAPNKKEIVIECNSPYPCAFDLGLIEALAKRFQSTATVAHDKSRPCRKQDGLTCTYVVTW